MGQAGTAKIQDGTRDKTGQSRKGCSKTGNGCSKTGKDVLKQENDVPKQEIWSFSCFGTSFSCFLCSFGKVILSRDRGVCPGTFASALVPGQRDTWTRNFFCPGTKGQRDVPSRGNPSLNYRERRIKVDLNLVITCTSNSISPSIKVVRISGQMNPNNPTRINPNFFYRHDPNLDSEGPT